MRVITPVFLDIFLFYCYLSTEYRLKVSRIKGGCSIVLLSSLCSLTVNTMPEVPFIQLLSYLMIMPFIAAMFYGNTWIKTASCLKLLLVLSALDLSCSYIFKQAERINDGNGTFILFIAFTVTARVLVYFFLKKRGEHKKINYFEVTAYRYILIKFIICIVLLIADSFIMINEEMLRTELLWDIKIILLIVQVVLLISIFEDIETEAQKVIQNMWKEHQTDLERNYLNVISMRTRELAKIRHDIKDHIFMINYLAEKDDIQGIRKYLGKIPAADGTALITIPQKEWLAALIYSKAEKAEQTGIEFNFENRWSPDLEILPDDMDMMSLTANLLDNAIEAAQKVTEKDKKKIGALFNENKGYLIIDVWNYYNKSDLDIKGNRFRTTKKDRQLHGKGTEIIREITEKYRGNFSYDIKDDKIVMKITIQNITAF